MYDSLKLIPDVPNLRDFVISEILLPMQDMATIHVITALFKVLIKNYQGSQKAQLLSSYLNKFPSHQRTLIRLQLKEQLL